MGEQESLNDKLSTKITRKTNALINSFEFNKITLNKVLKINYDL